MASRHPGTPGTRNRSATRERLLTAARHVMVEQGIQGASVERICEAAGFTRGAFYSNFDTKDDLVLAMFEHEKDVIFGHLNQAADSQDLAGLDDERAFAAIIDRFLVAAPDSADQYVVITEFALHAIRDSQVATAFGQFWSALLDDLCDLMTRVVDQRGRTFTTEPRHIALMLVGTWEMSLRACFIAGSQRDAAVLRQTLPALLVALTKVKP